MSRSLRATPFNIFSNITVSGSASFGGTTFTSSVSAISYKDNVGYQINFSGLPQGVFQINACNDFNPQLPESGNALGSSTNGTWATLASISASAAVSPLAFNLNQVPFGYIQFQFLSGTSSGVLTSGWVSIKGLG